MKNTDIELIKQCYFVLFIHPEYTGNSAKYIYFVKLLKDVSLLLV